MSELLKETQAKLALIESIKTKMDKITPYIQQIAKEMAEYELSDEFITQLKDQIHNDIWEILS